MARERTGTIRVDRVKLIAAITKRRSEIQTAFDKELEDYEKQFDPFKAAVVAALTDALAQAKRAKEFAHLDFCTQTEQYCEGADSVILRNIGQSRPLKPEKDTHRELVCIDQLLKRLALCTDDILELKDGDNYLRFI